MPIVSQKQKHLFLIQNLIASVSTDLAAKIHSGMGLALNHGIYRARKIVVYYLYRSHVESAEREGVERLHAQDDISVRLQGIRECPQCPSRESCQQQWHRSHDHHPVYPFQVVGYSLLVQEDSEKSAIWREQVKSEKISGNECTD
jgi:hypothetical protein